MCNREGNGQTETFFVVVVLKEGLNTPFFKNRKESLDFTCF